MADDDDGEFVEPRVSTFSRGTQAQKARGRQAYADEAQERRDRRERCAAWSGADPELGGAAGTAALVRESVQAQRVRWLSTIQHTNQLTASRAFR